MRFGNLSLSMFVYSVIWADLVSVTTRVLGGLDSLTCR